MKQLLIIALLSFVYSQPTQVVRGYLMQTEMSFCMDECGEYYIETFGDMYWPVIFNENTSNINLYINRYVEVLIGEEVTCVECSAYQVQEISLSDDCMSPVLCIVDPCEVASECQINTPTECIANYCGGCYADFYDLNDNLVDCNIPIEECEDGEIINDNPCNPLECWNGEWYEIIIDCAEQMGVPCLGGVYISPIEEECCSECVLFGDVNNDSEVNVLDIVHMVSFILMTYEPTDAEFSAGDINSDEQLNVLDVVAIVQMILNPINEDCYIEPEVGPCEGLCPTYYFNQITNECQEFMTGCCGVEVFNSMEACQSVCE